MNKKQDTIKEGKREIVIRLINKDDIDLYDRYIQEIVKPEGFSVMGHNKNVFMKHIKTELQIKE
jgi:hypothetical protein